MPSPVPTREDTTIQLPAVSQSQHFRQVASEDISVRPANRISAMLGQHWTIVGATGAGKTVFAKDLLEYFRRQYPQIPRYVLDSTMDGFRGVHAPLYVEGNRVPAPLHDATHTQIWTPDTDDLDQYDKWFHQILYTRRPAIVVIDEIASLSPRGDALEGHVKLLKQGRKHGVTILNLTQSISKVPSEVFSQMTHYIQFRIGKQPYDLSQARQYLDILPAEQRNPTAPYGFFHKHVRINSPIREYRNSSEFFNGSLRGER